jgi:hypothetical protein
MQEENCKFFENVPIFSLKNKNPQKEFENLAFFSGVWYTIRNIAKGRPIS